LFRGDPQDYSYKPVRVKKSKNKARVDGFDMDGIVVNDTDLMGKDDRLDRSIEELSLDEGDDGEDGETARRKTIAMKPILDKDTEEVPVENEGEATTDVLKGFLNIVKNKEEDQKTTNNAEKKESMFSKARNFFGL